MPTPEDTPWLSLLVPLYNVERYLPACLDSILSQAVDGIEVVLLNDASPDGSAAIAEDHARRHPQTLRLLAHDRNGGLSAARNSLLRAARGDYVWFLDSDDLLLPGAIAGLRAALAQPVDLVLCDFRMVRDRFGLKHRLRGELHRRTFAGDAEPVRRDRSALVGGLLGARQLHAWTKIARREVWAHAVFPEGRTFEDIAVIPALVAGTASYTHVPQPWVGYRQRDDSIMATMTPRKALDLMQSLRELAAGLRALDGLDADARFAIDYFCLRTLASTAGKTNDDTVLDACRQTLRAIFPAGTDDVLRECARRGWVLRRWRLRKGLQRMQGAA